MYSVVGDFSKIDKVAYDRSVYPIKYSYDVSNPCDVLGHFYD